jgi:hypothetical protein
MAANANGATEVKGKLGNGGMPCIGPALRAALWIQQHDPQPEFLAMSQRKIAEFQVYDLGIEHSQYFQGFGVAFTPYSECCYGIGDNPAEALDDALEQVAQMGFDADKLAERIKQVEGEPRTTPSVAEFAESDRGDDEESAEGGYDECHYHIGIRWNPAE